MTADVVSDTISEISQRMISLPVFGDSTSTTDNIKKHLLKIKEEVAAKLEQNDSKTRDWLGQVTDVVNDLLDLLEDISADAALLQKQNKIRSFFSFCNLTPHSPLLKLKEIENRLLGVAADATKLPMQNVEMLTNLDAEEQEIEIVGRKEEKEEILKRILRETYVEGAVRVVGRVGIKGIGKTKLAKSIYDDDKVKSNFALRIWIDLILERFNADFVKERIQTAKKKKLEDKNSVGEAMTGSGSRFFLVLDDLRIENREEWLKLQQILKEAASSSGAAVLITTQSNIVANIVQPWDIRPLQGLNEEDSWSLFERIAGEGPNESKITDGRQKMVKKCRGVPLAILTMARMLRSREAITESEVNKLEEEFMQELQMIYYNELPSWHLKRCFAYCSLIFSTARFADSETLIRLWIAEGLLGPTNSSSPQQPEDLGRECIQEFRRRSIFYAYESQSGIIKSCSMREEIMRDLSAFVAGEDSFCMDDPDKEVKERVRRVSLTFELDVSNGIPKSLFKTSRNLRTILLPVGRTYGHSRVPYEVKLSWTACEAIFSAFKMLRVLNLQDLGMKVLPSSIGELKSLRYVDLSKNNMKKLPNSIGELKHLQTLILSHCHELRELPNVEDLVSLRHLEMEGCLHLAHMPSTLKRLTWIQRLSHFVVSTGKKHNHLGGLGELINLNNLRGELEILHLERLKFKESKQEQDGIAYLREKQHLQRLTLRWNHDDQDDDNGEGHDDQISLGLLEPHPNLQELSIVGYKGNTFSDWLTSLENLVEFSLYNCPTIKSLLPLDQLPKLEILKLQRLDSLEFITDQDDGGNQLGLRFLKELAISDCPNLTSWWKGTTESNSKPSSFPSISRLRVRYCPKLHCMPLYPNLDDKLFLECSSLKPLKETINCITSTSTCSTTSDTNSSPSLSKLKFLMIANVKEHSPLPEEWLKNFTSLDILVIRECEGLKSLLRGFKHLSSLDILYIENCTELDIPSEEWEGLKNLRKLYIEGIHKLESLPEGIKHLTSLDYLIIESCPELTTLTEGIGDLKSLTSLYIEECHKLASLPQRMTNLTSLKKLYIRNCRLLLPRCQKETGDDWPQIKHIKDIDVKHTSEYYD